MSARGAEEARSTFERVLARRSHELARAQTERALELVEQGALRRTRSRGVSLARVAGAVVALLFLRLVVCGTPGRRGNEPLGAAAVATADGAGVGSSASAFLLPPATRPAVPEPSASDEPALSAPDPEPTLAPTRRTVVRVARATRAAMPAEASAPAADGEELAALAVWHDSQGAPDVDVGLVEGDTSAAPAPPPQAVINIGTRLRAKLDAPLRTGASLAPATAILAEDVRDGERVLLAAGTRLVGSAFATPNDSRVQIVWRALVHGGRTLAIQAETLGADGGPGVAGKLVRRNRKPLVKRIGATLAATAGDAAGYAVPLGDTALEQAAAALAGRSARDLGQLGNGREWDQADTVIELKAGTQLVVYVAADITLGASGAP